MLRKLISFALVCIMSLGLATSVMAEPGVTPKGPFVADNQEVKLEGFTDYDEMVKILKRYEKQYPDLVKLEVVGESVEGRDIYLVSVGNGPDNVMMISQQHGNEPHGTEAILQLIKDIASSGKPEFEKIRETLTVNMIPKLNPDGAEAGTRYVFDENAPNPRTFAEEIGFTAVDEDGNQYYPRLNTETYGMNGYEGLGWDPNRFHFIDWTTSPMYKYFPEYFPVNPAKEADICAKVVAKLNPKPLWFIDLHNQGVNSATPDGDLTTMALDTAHVTNDWDTDLQDPRVQQSSRLLVVINDHISEYGFSGTTRYSSPSAYSGRSRNQYLQVLDIPGVLIEIRGQYASLGQKSGGMLIKNCYESVFAVLKATAEDTVKDVDWERVSEIPNAVYFSK